MGLLSFLFSFKGRVRRRYWWLIRLFTLPFYGIINLIISGAANEDGGKDTAYVQPSDSLLQTSQYSLLNEIKASNKLSDISNIDFSFGDLSVFISVSFGFTILFFIFCLIWVDLANSVKRWHDRDKSGWWILISIIPIVGPIWALIECGFLPGTYGNNRFGPSPKAKKQKLTESSIIT